MSLMWPVQVALVAALKADSGVGALVADRIYDGQAPQGEQMPYIVVGDPTETPQNVLGSKGWSDTVTAHVFSEYNGTMKALAVIEAMDAALTSPLTISGHGAARLKPEFGTVLLEDSGVRHGVRRYRVTAFAA